MMRYLAAFIGYILVTFFSLLMLLALGGCDFEKIVDGEKPGVSIDVGKLPK